MDRNASVRSIMTLPAYNATPKDNEQVLGRAGERDGIDTVVQFPDIAEAAEEERREEEMEALYQVRLARRTEIVAREERRRLRREARERGDTVALEELRQNGRGQSNATLEALRAQHGMVRERPRAVSTVSYKDLGVARHDGTRIRANSEESERPLLGDAESMAATERGDPRNSTASFETLENSVDSPVWMRGRQTGYGNDGDEADLGAGLLSNQEPPQYDSISLGHGRDVPPGYVPTVGRNLTGYSSASERGDPSLSAHPPSQRSSPAPVPAPVPAPAPAPLATEPAAQRDLGLGLTLGVRSVSGPTILTTPLEVQQSEVVPASARQPAPRNVSMPSPSSFAVTSSPPFSSRTPSPPFDVSTQRVDTITPCLPSSSRTPSPPLDVSPQRVDTVTRKRNSINSLMGSTGRPASAEIPQSRTFVLHTPPIGAQTPASASLGEVEARRASRGSFVGLPRLLGSQSSASISSLASTPSIVVESATPVVGPNLGRGRGGLGWESERSGR